MLLFNHQERYVSGYVGQTSKLLVKRNMGYWPSVRSTAGYWPSSFFFACLLTETESRSINSQKNERRSFFVNLWTSTPSRRPISSQVDRTSLVNKGFIIWLSDTASSPEWARDSSILPTLEPGTCRFQIKHPKPLGHAASAQALLIPNWRVSFTNTAVFLRIPVSVITKKSSGQRRWNQQRKRYAEMLLKKNHLLICSNHNSNALKLKARAQYKYS